MPVPKPVPTIPFTQEAMDAIKNDHKKLTVERSEVMERLKTAREMGDLSENGAYKYAKFELGRISRQLHQLKHLIDHGYVRQSTANQTTVDFGSTVTLQQNTETLEFLIVSAHESDLSKYKLSMESPLGKALMNRSIGDTVTVVAPAGNISYTIVGIR